LFRITLQGWILHSRPIGKSFTGKSEIKTEIIKVKSVKTKKDYSVSFWERG
jgi:hypothetical protein